MSDKPAVRVWLVVQLFAVISSWALMSLFGWHELEFWLDPRGSSAATFTVTHAWLAVGLVCQPALLWVLADRLRDRRQPYTVSQRIFVLPLMILGIAAALPTLMWIISPSLLLLPTAAGVSGLCQLPYVWRRLGWLAGAQGSTMDCG